MIEDMDFSTALIHLKNGFNVARKGWNGRDMYLTLKQGYPVNGHIQPQHMIRKHHRKILTAVKTS